MARLSDRAGGVPSYSAPHLTSSKVGMTLNVFAKYTNDGDHGHNLIVGGMHDQHQGAWRGTGLAMRQRPHHRDRLEADGPIGHGATLAFTTSSGEPGNRGEVSPMMLAMVIRSTE